MCNSISSHAHFVTMVFLVRLGGDKSVSMWNTCS